MLVAGIGRFDGISARPNLQNEIDDISQRNIVLVRAMVAAPTHKEAQPVNGQISQTVVKGVDSQLLIFAILRQAHLRIHLSGVGEIRSVDLEDESCVDDGLVFLMYPISDSKEISLVGLFPLPFKFPRKKLSSLIHSFG
jgi:hypothetical protein